MVLRTFVSQLRLGPRTMSFFFHSWTWGYMETYGSTSVEHTFPRKVEKGKTQILDSFLTSFWGLFWSLGVLVVHFC